MESDYGSSECQREGRAEVEVEREGKQVGRQIKKRKYPIKVLGCSAFCYFNQVINVVYGPAKNIKRTGLCSKSFRTTIGLRQTLSGVPKQAATWGTGLPREYG